MTKKILIDKFLAPFLILLFSALVFFKKAGDWTFVLFFLSIVAIFLLLIAYSREDNYIKKHSFCNSEFSIDYHKNFKKYINNVTVNLYSIKKVKFSSNKSFFNPFHVVTIKYIDKEGLHQSKTFKIENDASFIILIYELNIEKVKAYPIQNQGKS